MLFDGVDLRSKKAIDLAKDILASIGAVSTQIGSIQAFSAHGQWNVFRSSLANNVFYFLDIQNPNTTLDITAFTLNQPSKRSLYVGKLRHYHQITTVGAVNPSDTNDYLYGITKAIYVPVGLPPIFSFKRAQMAPPAVQTVWGPASEVDVSFTYLHQFLNSQSNVAGLSVTYSYFWDFDGVKIN